MRKKPNKFPILLKTKKMRNGDRRELLYDKKGRYFFRFSHVTKDGDVEIDEQVGVLWTAFTKGEYCEEIDVYTRPGAKIKEVKEVAAAAIEAHYMKGLEVGRVVHRPPGVMFV